MTRSRTRVAWIVLGLLTTVQVAIGARRAVVMFREGLAAGVEPLRWSAALGEDLLLCGLLALAAWWWLPARGPRRPAAWAVRFLLLAWLVGLFHYAWGLLTGRLEHAVTWLVIALLFAAGAVVRRVTDEPVGPAAPEPHRALRHPATWLAILFYAAQAPHLVFPYHYTDAVQIWACRAFQFAARGGMTGIFDCLDPARPPLHSIQLWLGIEDPTFQGRLLPFLLVGAFGLLLHHLLRRVAPRLAPWGLLWFFATGAVLQQGLNSYAGVPQMLAIGVCIALATDDGTLAGHRRLGIAWGLVAGAAVALIKRDGMPELVVVAGVLIVLAADRRDPRLWAPLVGVALGYLSWVVRPAELLAPALFEPSLGSWTPAAALRAMKTLLFGVQGQVFSHYGWGAFAWTWIIVAVWAWRQGPGSELARRWGLVGLAGWVATLGLYVVLTFLGQPQMSTLYVIRTGFGRHLVHFFPFCLLHATAAAERLIRAPEPRAAG
ncbi:MAG: hypothetical protein ACREMF_10725 [Gemmatimonadales bacterium]